MATVSQLSLDYSEPLKTCRICEVARPHSEFALSQQTKDGRYPYCKPCVRARRRPTHQAKRAAERAEGVKTCTGCGVQKPREDFNKQASQPDGHQPRCRDCTQAVQREAKALDPEKKRRQDRECYYRNRESRIARVQARYWQDPAKAKARSLEWARKHPEKVRASRSSWAKRNPDLIRDYCRQRRAWRAGVRCLPITAADLEAKFAFWGHCCWLCGGEPDAIDHVKPVSRGGAHMLCNLRPVCTPCNTRKKDRWPLD